MVGVGSYARWPPEAEALPKLGGLFDPQLETIAALEPDLAVLLPSESIARDQLERLGVEVLTLPSESLADVESALSVLAERLGVEERGRQLLEEWHRDLVPRTVPSELSVLLVIGRERGRMGDLLVAGEGTFLDELVGRLGARNAADGLPVRYAQIGAEELLVRSPQLIVELRTERSNDAERAALIAEWSVFPQVEAVRSGCVEVIEGDYTLLPGPRLPRLYAELGAALDHCVGRR